MSHTSMITSEISRRFWESPANEVVHRFLGGLFVFSLYSCLLILSICPTPHPNPLSPNAQNTRSVFILKSCACTRGAHTGSKEVTLFSPTLTLASMVRVELILKQFFIHNSRQRPDLCEIETNDKERRVLDEIIFFLHKKKTIWKMWELLSHVGCDHDLPDISATLSLLWVSSLIFAFISERCPLLLEIAVAVIFSRLDADCPHLGPCYSSSLENACQENLTRAVFEMLAGAQFLLFHSKVWMWSVSPVHKAHARLQQSHGNKYNCVMLKGAARISGKRRLCPCVSNLLQAIIHVESGFFFFFLQSITKICILVGCVDFLKLPEFVKANLCEDLLWRWWNLLGK